MFKKAHLIAAMLTIPSLVACGNYSSLLSGAPAATSQASTYGTNAVVKDSGLGGSRFASFNVVAVAPTSTGMQTQSVVHRYTASDISYYVLTLYDMTQGTNGTQVAQVQVSPNDSGVFTHLLVNTLYKVKVSAYSYVQADGTTGTQAQLINANDPWNTAEFNFTSGSSSNNNVDNQITYCSTNFYNALTVHIDNSAFDGTATFGTSPSASFSVYDGAYTNPSQGISATTQHGSTCNCSTSGSGNTDQQTGQDQ